MASSFTRRSTGALAVLMVLGLALAAAAPGPRVAAAGSAEVGGAQVTTLRFGSPGAVSDAGIFLGRAFGYLREQGLDVEVVPFQTGSETIPPLASGDLDLAGGTVSTALFNAIDRGVGIKAIADKGAARPGFEFTQLTLRRDLWESGAVRDVGDLRGRRVAIGALRSGPEASLAYLLGRGGVTLGEVDVVTMSYPDMLVAFGNRSIDAGILIEPLLSAAVERGLVVTWESGRFSAVYGGVYQAAIVVISGRFAAQPELVRRFMVAYLRGVRAYNDAFLKGEGRAEVIRALAEQSTVRDPAVYERMQMAGLDPDGRMARQSLQLDLDYFRQLGYYSGPLTLDAVLDTSYAEYAAQQLGPYR